MLPETTFLREGLVNGPFISSLVSVSYPASVKKPVLSPFIPYIEIDISALHC